MTNKTKNQNTPRHSESGRPEDGSGEGRRDETGVMPDAKVDPDITEGHPGYEESGDSEIIPAPAESDRKE